MNYDLTLNEAFMRAAKEFSDKVCLQLKDEKGALSYTYQEAYNAVLTLSRWLSESGIKKGDRVALILENDPHWCICYFGILFAGAIAVPIDIQASYQEVEYFLNDSQSKVVFASSGLAYLKDLEGFDFLEKIVLVDREESSSKTIGISKILSLPLPESRAVGINPDDLASIIYTSGTTDIPKGVMLSHKNFYSNFLSLKELNILKPTDSLISILPLHHAYAFMVTLITPLLLGAKITYVKTLRPQEILKVLNEEKITIMVVVPQILYLFERGIKERLQALSFHLRLIAKVITRPLIRSFFGKDIRLIVCGGAKLNKQTAEFFFKLGFKVLEGYGLTETSPVASLNPLKRPKIGSVGKPICGVEVKILNPDKTGTGEILIKGANVMKGYYHDQARTNECLKKEWFYSGDLGYMDKEGYLYIKGREKEIIVLSSGKNISPEEVEAHYLKSLFIKEICIMADEKDQILEALVVPNFEYFKKMKETNIYDIIKWNLEYLSQKLASYKRIRRFVLVSENLPRTRLGKIKRFKTREIYQNNLSKEPVQKKEIKEELSAQAKSALNILKKERKVESVSLDDHLELDLGIDSLARIELMLALEKAFKVKIKEEEFANIFSVDELLQYMEQATAGSRQTFKIEEPIVWENILKSPPSKSLQKKIDLNPSFLSKLLIFPVIVFLDFFFRILFRLKVQGKSNLLKERFILCPNHTSYLDAFVVFSSLPLKLKYEIFFIGLSKFFQVPIIRGLIRYLKVVPVDFSSNLIETMQASSMILRDKRILCVFPEGARSLDGKMREFKKGVGILAKEMDTPIIPIYIQGAYCAWKPTKRFPHPYPIRIFFGQAHTPQELKIKGLSINKDADDYEAISLGIREEIKKLGG